MVMVFLECVTCPHYTCRVSEIYMNAFAHCLALVQDYNLHVVIWKKVITPVCRVNQFQFQAKKFDQDHGYL